MPTPPQISNSPSLIIELESFLQGAFREACVSFRIADKMHRLLAYFETPPSQEPHFS